MKKIISLALVLALMLTMSVCAFAADLELYVGETATIEIDSKTEGGLGVFRPVAQEPTVYVFEGEGDGKVDVTVGETECTSFNRNILKLKTTATWKTPIEIMGTKAGLIEVVIYNEGSKAPYTTSYRVPVKELPKPKPTSVYRENYIPDLTGGRVLNITNIGEMFGQKNLNAATVGANNTLQNLYDDRGNLIVNVTLSTDGHVYFVPTETGMITMEAARGPQFASQEDANLAYEAAVKAYLAKAAAQNEAYIAAVNAANK